MTILNEQTLTQLGAGVSVPRYDRRQFTAAYPPVVADLQPGAVPRTVPPARAKR